MPRRGVRPGRDVVIRAFPMTIVCAAALVGVPAVVAQTGQSPPVDCATACRVNRATAPPTCDCAALTAGDRTAERVISLDDLDPVEELRKLFDAEAQRMAAVENYLVVETLNIAPMPSVQYWQRESTPDGPVYRLVPPHELAQLDAKAQAEKAGTADGKAAAELMGDPTAFLDVLAQGLKAAGGTGSGAGSAGGLLGQLAGALSQVGADVKAQDAQDRQDLQKDGPHPLLDMALAKIPELKIPDRIKADRSASRQLGLGLYFPDRATPSERFVRLVQRNRVVASGRAFVNVNRNVQWVPPWDSKDIVVCGEDFAPADTTQLTKWSWLFTDTCRTVPPGAVLAEVIVLAVPFDLEWETTTYTVERAEFWSARYCDGAPEGKQHVCDGADASQKVRLLSRIEGYQTALGGFRRFVIEHETDQFRQAGPALMPHRTRQRVGTDDNPLPEIVKTIQKISVNEGPPTQAELAAILADALGKPTIKAPEVR